MILSDQPIVVGDRQVIIPQRFGMGFDLVVDGKVLAELDYRSAQGLVDKADADGVKVQVAPW